MVHTKLRRISLFVVTLLSIFLVFLECTQTVSAEAPLYSVNFNSSFNNDNIGVDYINDHTYADRISFASNMESLDGYTFSFWIVNGIVRWDLPVDHNFVVNGDMNIEAIFSDDQSSAVVFMDTNGDMLKLEYVLQGDNATPPVTTSTKPGFVENPTTPWDGSYENVTDHCVLILQYTIDTSTTFSITVTNGTGGGTHGYNDVVTVTADAPTGSDVFSHWLDGQTIVSYQETYSFTALSDRDLTAVYTTETPSETSLITLSDDLGIRSNYASYKAQFELPTDHQLIEYGILRSNTVALPDLDSQDTVQYKGDKYHGPTKEFLMSFSSQMVYQRAYLVSEDASGNLHYTYSDVVETVTYSMNLSANHASAVVDTVQAPPYFAGDLVDITASSVTGYNFLHWYDLDNNEILTTTQNPTLTMTRNYNIEARYQDENIIFDYDFSELTTLPSNLTYSKSYSGGDILFNSFENVWAGTTADYLRMNFSTTTSGDATLTIVFTNYNIDPEWDSICFYYSSQAGMEGYTNNYYNGTYTITKRIPSGTDWFKIEYNGSDLFDTGVYTEIHSITVKYD